MPSERQLLLLDACCLIDLLASGRMEEILEVLPFRFATSRLIATTEILSIAVSEPTASLALLDLATDREISDFVRFAAVLDDGEASVCALALSHGGGVATDDRKALAVLKREAPQVPTLQTPELLHAWADLAKPPAPEVSRVLQSIERGARSGRPAEPPAPSGGTAPGSLAAPAASGVL